MLRFCRCFQGIDGIASDRGSVFVFPFAAASTAVYIVHDGLKTKQRQGLFDNQKFHGSAKRRSRAIAGEDVSIYIYCGEFPSLMTQSWLAISHPTCDCYPRNRRSAAMTRNQRRRPSSHEIGGKQTHPTRDKSRGLLHEEHQMRAEHPSPLKLAAMCVSREVFFLPPRYTKQSSIQGGGAVGECEDGELRNVTCPLLLSGTDPSIHK